MSTGLGAACSVPLILSKNKRQQSLYKIWAVFTNLLRVPWRSILLLILLVVLPRVLLPRVLLLSCVLLLSRVLLLPWVLLFWVQRHVLGRLGAEEWMRDGSLACNFWFWLRLSYNLDKLYANTLSFPIFYPSIIRSIAVATLEFLFTPVLCIVGK